jgi:hypothetical protein
MVVGVRAGLALLALGALQRSASGAPSDHVGLHHNHMCSQPHCPLASFKQPDRPLAQLKGLLSGIRQRAMQIAVQLHRRRRAHALRQLQGEMVFGRQMRDDLFPLEASVEPAVPPPQQQPPQPAAAAAVGPDGMAALLDAGLTVVDEIVEMSGVQKPRAVSRGSPARCVRGVARGGARGEWSAPAGDAHGVVVLWLVHRRFLTYGNWVVDGVGFFLKVSGPWGASCDAYAQCSGEGGLRPSHTPMWGMHNMLLFADPGARAPHTDARHRAVPSAWHGAGHQRLPAHGRHVKVGAP